MPIRLATPASRAYAYPLLIRRLLQTAIAAAPAQEIVYRDRVRHTYGTLNERVGRLASGLARLGVEPGTTVAVMDWDSHRYLECFFSVPMMGAVLMTVNVRLTPAQIAYTLNDAGAEVLLLHRDFIPIFEAFRGQVRSLRKVVLIEDGAAAEAATPWAAAEFEQLVAESSPDYAFEDFDENALATTFYTTGTTGDPKGVCFSHRQLVLHTLALLCACASPAYGQSFRHGDVYLPLTPMFHVHAWGFPYVATMLGVKQVYPGRWTAADILSLRAREQVTFSHCVPTVLQLLLAEAQAIDANPQGWKICIGGSVLTPGLARAALARGVDVFAAYGMSETAPVLTMTRLQQAPTSPASEREVETRCRTGLPIPLVELRLVAPGSEVPDASSLAEGELTVRTPWLTPCYVGKPAASEDLWREGYLHTQDVARIDAQGYLQITDRLKDVIKTGGEWVSSIDLENLISRHPDVLEVAVVAVSDVVWGERPHVLVVPRPERGKDLTAQEVRDVVVTAVADGVLPRFAVPERITFVERLEKTSVGKINKRALRDQYGTDVDRSLAPGPCRPTVR